MASFAAFMRDMESNQREAVSLSSYLARRSEFDKMASVHHSDGSFVVQVVFKTPAGSVCGVSVSMVKFTSHNLYETALINADRSLMYVESLGYDDVRLFSTREELVAELLRIMRSSGS